MDYDVKTKQEENVHRGSISLTEKNKEIELKKVDVIIMNPPFTSCDNLPQEYKEQLRSRFKTNSSYYRCLTGKLSFQAYFIFLADKF
jgi:tRNA1(Val) A37 N6-methylase TrmN6